MNNIVITLLKPSEWPIYKEIQLEALKEDPGSFGASYKEWVTFSNEKWQERPSNPNSRIFIAKDKEKPIGLVGVYFYVDKGEQAADIWGMYVNHNYRNQGIATTLLNKACEIVKQKGLQKVQLMVEYNPNPAQQLYKSVGFKPVNTLDYVLGDGKKHKLFKMEKSF